MWPDTLAAGLLRKAQNSNADFVHLVYDNAFVIVFQLRFTRRRRISLTLTLRLAFSFRTTRLAHIATQLLSEWLELCVGFDRLFKCNFRLCVIGRNELEQRRLNVVGWCMRRIEFRFVRYRQILPQGARRKGQLCHVSPDHQEIGKSKLQSFTHLDLQIAISEYLLLFPEDGICKLRLEQFDSLSLFGLENSSVLLGAHCECQ
jgi:hypothetical protein